MGEKINPSNQIGTLMSFPRLDKKYVSEIDQFLVDFDKQNPKKSTSQLKEIQKAERVSRLMKDSNMETTDNSGKNPKLWDEF